uniref:Peptidase S8/S53 domain-containing protein n=1 Tax=Panagrolaimus sp. ES5 TaxID=591445 RepID=A0AC34FFD9_9BILA
MSICDDYIPKAETQQSKFLKQYLKYNGRGLLIALIDHGVDISLPGMLKTSTGFPKLLIVLILLIPQHWKNPSGEWHLGIKSLLNICPKNKRLNSIENLKKKIAEEIAALKTQRKTVWKTDENKKLAQIFSTEFLVDCIVWNDGEKWQACLDTSLSKNLDEIKILTNFRDEHEFSFIFEELSYCITIEEDGNLVKIFVPTSDHGSCVANNAAAHFPGEPEKDGLAPGAHIVSMNVLDQYETDHRNSINDAVLKCIEIGMDIVNISMLVAPYW